MDRAYSLIEVKSLDAEQRIIEGMATTPTPDRVDDVVDPFGAKFKNPLPFILHHDRTSPVGTVTFHRPTSKGIPFTAHIPKVVEPGIVRDRTDEAWHSAKYGLLRGVSIGYRPLKAEPRSTGGLHLKEIEVVELSMVAVPANAETTISAVKSLDAAHLAAVSSPPSRPTPGVPGSAHSRTMNQTISEQVAAEARDLQTKGDRLRELMDRDGTDGGLIDSEKAEMDGLTTSITEQTTRLARLKALEAAQMAGAAPVVAVKHDNGNGRDHYGRPVTVPRVEVTKPDLPKGTAFARYAMAVAAGKGSFSDTVQYARRWDSQTPEVSAHIKATWGMSGDMLSQMIAIKAIAGTATVGSPAWGGELAYANNLASEFVELLRNATIIGRLPGLRRVPFNVRVGVQVGGSTVNWVQESNPKPVGELDFSEATLTYSKVAGIVVLSDELIRLSTPNAEEVVRTDLTAAVQQFIDQQLLDPTVTATAARPASLTNGVTGSAATGTTAADLRADINTILLAPYDTADIPTTSVVLLMPSAVARGIAALTTSLGGPEFANMGPNGGTLMGFPVIVSNSVPAGNIIAVAANEVWLADDGQVTLDASNQATLDMAGGSTATFNLWQNNCTGIRAERWIRWQKRRTAAVQRITGAAYAP